MQKYLGSLTDHVNCCGTLFLGVTLLKPEHFDKPHNTLARLNSLKFPYRGKGVPMRHTHARVPDADI